MTEYIGAGMTVGYDLAGGTSYTTLGQLHDVQLPGFSRDYVEVSRHDHTDLWKRFIKGWKDGGEMTLIVIYDPVNATHDASTGLLAEFDEDSTIPTWEITFPDDASTSWTFTAGVSSAKPGTPLQDKMTLEIGVKLTEGPTLA
jgi:hypothetical protein